MAMYFVSNPNRDKFLTDILQEIPGELNNPRSWDFYGLFNGRQCVVHQTWAGEIRDVAGTRYVKVRGHNSPTGSKNPWYHRRWTALRRAQSGEFQPLALINKWGQHADGSTKSEGYIPYLFPLGNRIELLDGVYQEIRPF